MLAMAKLVFLHVFYYLLVDYCVRTESECVTPNREIGTCLLIYDCPVLLNGLIEANTADERKFLRDSFCGWAPNGPNVCCGTRSFDVVSRSSTNRKRDLLPNTTMCGFQDKDKVLGGTSTDITEFPWMALLVYKDRHDKISFQCGGALINERYVLTAAHCRTRDLSRVRLGEWNLKTTVDCLGKGLAAMCTTYTDVEIESMKVHEHYVFDRVTGLSNDIALIRLKESVNYSSFIQPICLPTLERDIVGKDLWVAGWGITNVTTRATSDIKQKVNMKVMSFSECRRKYKGSVYRAQVHDSNLCAEGKEKKGSCIGDSGNPFVTTVNDQEAQFYVEGIVSYSGQFCTDVPVVFTRVFPFLDWIEANVEP